MLYSTEAYFIEACILPLRDEVEYSLHWPIQMLSYSSLTNIQFNVLQKSNYTMWPDKIHAFLPINWASALYIPLKIR